MNTAENPIKILIAKPGLDGHWRGAMTLALGLRDEGFEVIYTESVNVVGLSCLSGSHNYLFPKVVDLLKENGMNDILVLGGGIIPKTDFAYLESKGISKCFGPGTSLKEIAEYIRLNVKQ